MSDIVEEDHIIKDDSGHHANSRKGWNVKNTEVKYRELCCLFHACLLTQKALSMHIQLCKNEEKYVI